jgi:hypothetical protein
MASTLDAGATIERIDTARWTGTGVYLSQQSDTPSAGNAIKRKVYYKNEFGSTAAFVTWTLIHEFANNTSYATALEYINDTIIAGQTNGTAPASLVMTWEDTSAFTGLLDDYPGAAAAYSLRLLDTTYTGSAIRVRRASDNAEQDIGFDNNELDTSALATFCSGTDGFVKTWYSQTGSNDATQTTTTRQPKIYDSSTGVVTENGKPAVEYDGSSTVLGITESFSGNTLFGFGVVADFSVSGNKHLWSNLDTFNDGVEMRSVPSFSEIQIAINSIDTALSHSSSGQLLSVYGYNGSTATLAVDGTSTTASVTQTISVSSGSGLGGRLVPSPSAFIDGTIQEFVLYTSDQSSNRTGIEDNINDFYSIY